MNVKIEICFHDSKSAVICEFDNKRMIYSPDWDLDAVNRFYSPDKANYLGYTDAGLDYLCEVIDIHLPLRIRNLFFEACWDISK